jgi:hypothetical protein
MGSSSITSFRRMEEIFNKANYTFSTFVSGSSVTLCVIFADNCKCCLGPRDGNQRCNKADVCLLHIRSTEPIQKKLHRDGEGPLCNPDEFKKASALFPVLQHYCTVIITTQGYYKKQSSFGPNWKVGSRTQRVHH